MRETVPDWVLGNASEIVMMDLTPEALHNRMRRGDVYSVDKVEQALKNFFRRGNLIALRELALRQVAEQVDRSLESYMAAKDIQHSWPVRESIAVSISSESQGAIPDGAGRRAWPGVWMRICMWCTSRTGTSKTTTSRNPWPSIWNLPRVWARRWCD